MTRVKLVTEDKTGGGLVKVVTAMVKHLRNQQGRVPLHLSDGTVNGNAELLKQCAKYENFRFNYRPPLDHVFYVIDARNAWDLPQLKVQAPQAPFTQSLPSFISAVREEMEALARGSRSEVQWQKIRAGFHAHVLVWERESLLLPVVDRLGLGEAVADVYERRRAFEVISEMFRRGNRERKKYDKAVDGPLYLQRIAEDEQMRNIVLASNPSLQAIVDDLASL